MLALTRLFVGHAHQAEGIRGLGLACSSYLSGAGLPIYHYGVHPLPAFGIGIGCGVALALVVGALALSAAAKRIELGARAHALDRPAVAVALLIAEFARARVALQGWLSASQAGAQSSSLLSR